MDPLEAAAIGISGVAILCLTPDATTRTLILVVGMLVAATLVSSSNPDRSDPPPWASARRASRAQAHNTPTRNSGNDLPKTANPRQGGANGNDLPKTANPRQGGANGNDLPKTANPRQGGADGNDLPPTAESTDGARRVDPYTFQFTHAAMQARRDEFAFRKNPLSQTAEARARLLDDMYQELLDTSMKTDPGLKPVGTRGDGCEPMRGLTKAHLF